MSFLTFNYDIRSCQVAVLLLGSDNPEGEGEKPGEEGGEKFKIKAETREAKSINVSRQVPSTLRDTLTARSLLRITAQLILGDESERASERARAAPGRTERRRLNSGADGRTDGSGGWSHIMAANYYYCCYYNGCWFFARSPPTTA